MRLSLVAVLALVLIACTPAEAAPVIGAIVAAVGLTGTAATIASAVLTIGVGVGLQLLGNVLRPRQKAQPPAGYEADVTLGGDVYQRAIFGRAATKGHLVYINTSGSVNQRLDQVYVVSAGWCDGLDAVLLDTESLPLTQVDSGTGWTKYAVTLPDDGGTRRLWATFWDGRPDQASNATLVATANPSGRWTAAHRGRGQAYVHIEADYAASVESFAGLLNGNLLTFVVRGLRLYDLRKDTTAGGSGSHRWDDPSTWEFSEAPAVCLYNFMAGIYVNGQRVIGMGRARYRLLSAQFMAAANVCDETVSVPGGGTEPRYRLSLIVDDSPQYGQAVERMVQAMAGQRIEGPGYHGIQAGAAQVPVTTITDADLSATAALSHSNNRSFFDLVNEVWGQFLDPAAGWQPQDYPAVIGDAGMKAADGGATLPSDLDCTQMPSGTQAQRCATIALKRNRHERTARIPVGLKWWRLEPGDWVVWDSARYGTVTFQVVDRTLDTDRHLIFLSLQEVSASIFTAGALTAVPLPPTPPGLPARPTNVSGLTLQTATVSGEGGQAVPALVVGWDPITDETIRSVEVEYRRVGETGAGERRSSTRPASGDWDGITIAGSLMAGTDYEVRVTITTVPIRRTTWSDWSQIETSGEWRVQSAGALYNAATAEAVPAADVLAGLSGAAEGLSALEAGLADVSSSLGATAEGLRESVYEQLHRIAIEEEAAGRSVDVREAESAATRARLEHAELLVATEEQARVADVTTLTASLASTDAALAGNASAISGLDVRLETAEGSITSQAGSIIALTADLGDLAEDVAGNGLALAAQSEAIIGLDARVTEAEGAITATATDVAALASGLETVEGNVAGNSSALVGLETRVETAESAITATASQVADLESQLETVEGNVAGNATALSGLDTRVTNDLRRSTYDQLDRIVTEAGLEGRTTDWREAQSSAVIALRAALTSAEGGIAGNATALSGLTARVTTAEGAIVTQAAQLVSLGGSLTDLAGDVAGAATAISGIETRVSSAEDAIVAQASAITSLSTTVGEHTTSISTLTSSVNGLSAQWGVSITTDGVPVGTVALTGVTTLDGTSTSSLVFDVDNFILGKTGESGSFQPMVVWDAVNNRLALNNLLAVNATIGRIRSANDRIDINLDAGYIRITTPDP